MNLSDSLFHSFLPRLGKVPLRFTSPKTWKQGGYKNEFVGDFSSTTNVSLETPSQITKCYTIANGSFNQDPSVIYIPLCSNLSSSTEPVYFPVSLVRLIDTFKPALENSKKSAIVISQGSDFIIPNVTNKVSSEVQLYSITGAKLNIDLERNNAETLFRTKNLLPGVYLLLVNTDNKIETTKVIVQ